LKNGNVRAAAVSVSFRLAFVFSALASSPGNNLFAHVNFPANVWSAERELLLLRSRASGAKAPQPNENAEAGKSLLFENWPLKVT
jgi:hypothetical protein